MNSQSEMGKRYHTNLLVIDHGAKACHATIYTSKISKISVLDLRQDDHLAESRGYIRLGKDGNLTDTSITEETCMRWRALRVYIQVWARQHPNMAEEEFPIGGRGTAVRKGSWAL